MARFNKAKTTWTTFKALYFFLLEWIDISHSALLINEQATNSQISVTTTNLKSNSDNISEVPTEVKKQYTTQYPSMTLNAQSLYVTMSSEIDKNRSLQNSQTTSLNTTNLITAITETGPLEEENSGCTIDAQTFDSTRFFTWIRKVPSNVTSESSASVANCYFKIQVQSDQFISVVNFLSVQTSPRSDCIISIGFCRQKNISCTSKSVTGNTKIWQSVYYEYQDHEIYVVVTCPSCFSYNILLKFTNAFKSQKGLPIIRTSNKAGYITTPGFDDNKPYPSDLHITAQLIIEPDEIIFITFTHFHIASDSGCRFDSLTLSVINETGMFEEWKKCGMQDIPHMIFNTSIHLRFVSDFFTEMSGFKMLFTILSNAKELVINDEGLFNCSVPYFSQFARHLNCNLVVECMRMEDEKACPYTSKTCGPGSIDAGEKCYTYIRKRQNLSWNQAHSKCLNLSQTLVSPRNPNEWNRFSSLMMQYGKKTIMVYTGLKSSHVRAAAVPSLYFAMLQWSDQTMALYANVQSFHKPIPVCTMFLPQVTVFSLQTVSCVQPNPAAYACDRFKPSAIPKPGKILLPPLDANYTWPVNVTVISCSAGHKVRDFLSCDPQSKCQDVNQGMNCQTQGNVLQFQCEHISQSIHYTLVCDFRLDCLDGSDESFCIHPLCPEDSCRSGQCIRSSERCNGIQHCVDSTDENCPQEMIDYWHKNFLPSKIDFSGHGGYTLEPMNVNDSCPITHFPCGDGHCLPIYVRCNGVDDCPDRRDEEDCDSYRCQGFFRCRASRVCLHPDHVCDGVSQCPQQDDELLCDLKCPLGCYCQGLAFVCTRSFSAKSVPSLRYLDASGTKMTLDELSDNFYLIYICFSKCNIDKIPSMNLSNVQTLDISHNVLKSLKIDSLLSFKNLKAFILTGNPLTAIVPATTSRCHNSLKIIDFASTKLVTINNTLFANFPDLQELNLSSSSLTTITEGGFNIIQNIKVLDFRKSHLTTYPSDMLKNLKFLKTVYADDFKLCCKAVLPEDFDMENCHAPSDFIASCEDLLRSDVYRVCLWLFAFLTLIGNAGSFVARFYFQSESFQNSFNVFVTNLSVADFLMGMYLAIIGVADQSYRGRYVWTKDKWKQSIACKTAGFLSLLSTEISAFFICLVTLDRFLVLRFPFSRIHFNKKSALVACGIAWLIGFTLAVVPLLPMTSNWKFYSRIGICIPLPFTDNDTFQGQSYSFSVMIVLNLVIFLLIAVGQVFIYSAVRTNSMSQVKKNAFRDAAIARRLTTIVVSDFLCWFPIGLLGLLTSIGIPISRNVNVGVAILVLPFNSAVNPFLYTFNIVMEKRRKAAEARMLSRLHTQLTVTKVTALNQIDTWIGESVLTLSDLTKRFEVTPNLATTGTEISGDA